MTDAENIKRIRAELTKLESIKARLTNPQVIAGFERAITRRVNALAILEKPKQ